MTMVLPIEHENAETGRRFYGQASVQIANGSLDVIEVAGYMGVDFGDTPEPAHYDGSRVPTWLLGAIRAEFDAAMAAELAQEKAQVAA